MVGWDGCLYPYAFNVTDFEPITGRVHQPPPVHQVFEGHNFVICNFVPRKVDYHPLAVPVPYYHSNVDSDEVMFYVDGDYEARKGSGIGKGSISPAPRRAQPRPAARRRRGALGAESFDELAVMVDTFRPLELGEGGPASDDGRLRLDLGRPGAVVMTSTARRPFRRLFDDAAMFPPGRAPMADAVTAHARAREAWYRDLVGPFVVPAARPRRLAAPGSGRRYDARRRG